jgi:hypothetical protein
MVNELIDLWVIGYMVNGLYDIMGYGLKKAIGYGFRV